MYFMQFEGVEFLSTLNSNGLESVITRFTLLITRLLVWLIFLIFYICRTYVIIYQPDNEKFNGKHYVMSENDYTPMY